MQNNLDTKYWIALSTHSKIGARTFTKLYKRFKTLDKVWQSRERELTEAGLDLGQIEAVKEVVAKKNPDHELEKVKKLGIEVIILPDKNYPVLLKEISDPPGILYIKGKILPQDEISLAVVGSRKFSLYGKRATEAIVWPLAKNHLTIISGLALGIDAIAHEVALSAQGRTLAILGCGLDQIYPVTNIRLADKILKNNGALISEFPLGMPALKYNFPIRNRIIAGLTLGTLVIECAEGSGSLLTAAAAIDYNREVFAVPGEIFAETSLGTNRLIKMGAKMVTGYKDILAELQIKEKIESAKIKQILPDSREEEILLELLKSPQLVDQLVNKSSLNMAAVNSTLILMEMKGKVKNLGGTRYVVNK